MMVRYNMDHGIGWSDLALLVNKIGSRAVGMLLCFVISVAGRPSASKIYFDFIHYGSFQNERGWR